MDDPAAGQPGERAPVDERRDQVESLGGAGAAHVKFV
jgi:hypothetical protein